MAGPFALRDFIDLAVAIESSISQVYDNQQLLQSLAEDLHDDIKNLHNCIILAETSSTGESSVLDAAFLHVLSALRTGLTDCLRCCNKFITPPSRSGMAAFKLKLVAWKARDIIPIKIETVKRRVDACYRRFMIAGITGIRQEIKGQIVNCIQVAQSSQAKAVHLIGADDMDKGEMKDALIRAKEELQFLSDSSIPESVYLRLKIRAIEKMLSSSRMSSASAPAPSTTLSLSATSESPRRLSAPPSLPSYVASNDFRISITTCSDPSRSTKDTMDDAVMRILRLVDALADVKNQDELHPDAADNLTALSLSLGHLGLIEESCKVAGWAVIAYRCIDRTYPSEYRAKLASALNHHSVRLAQIGDSPDQALDEVDEALGIYRELSKEVPDAFRADLSSSLNNLSNTLAAMGLHKESLEAQAESVDILRALCSADSDRFGLPLIRSLNNLSSALKAVADNHKALLIIEEAVHTMDALTWKDSKVTEPILATCLFTLAQCLHTLGRTKKSIKALKRSIQIRRELCRGSPKRHYPPLADAFAVLSEFRSKKGDHPRALREIEKAVWIDRSWIDSKRDSQTQRQSRASHLARLFACLVRVDRRHDALKAVEETVQIWRELAEANPGKFRPDLATSLHNLSVHLFHLERYTDAARTIEETVEIRKSIAETRCKEDRVHKLLRNSEEVKRRIQEQLGT